MRKIILITGCSSGIGLETSILLAKDNKVYATMRNMNKKNPLLEKAKKNKVNLTILKLNVDNDETINKTINYILHKEGRLNILINNAGYGLIGTFEKFNIKDAKKQFETNFFGAVRCIKAVLPIMKKQKNGLIINISSIAGIIGRRFSSIYSSSKFALEGLSESLYEELKPLGIKIKIIEPGPTATNFFLRNQKKYNFKKPEEVAKIVKKAIEDKSNRIRYQVGRTNEKIVHKKLKDIKNYIKI